jgi:hypothetical protein
VSADTKVPQESSLEEVPFTELVDRLAVASKRLGLAYEALDGTEMKDLDRVMAPYVVKFFSALAGR